MEIVAIVISAISLVVSVVSLWQSSRATKQANAIALQQAHTGERTFAAQYLPVITLNFGIATDLLTDPPTRVFQLFANNTGHVRIVLESVGFIFWSGEDFRSFSYARSTGSRILAFPKLPHELLPRTKLAINMEMNDVIHFVEIHRQDDFPEVALYVADPIGERFETERMPTAEFISKLRIEEAGSRISRDHPAAKGARAAAQPITLRRPENPVVEGDK